MKFHAREGKHDHERQRDGPDCDLREGDIGGLKHEEHQGRDQAIEAKRDHLLGHIPGTDNSESGRDDQAHRRIRASTPTTTKAMTGAQSDDGPADCPMWALFPRGGVPASVTAKYHGEETY